MQSERLGTGHIGYFNNLKADSRNITYSMTFSTKSSNQNFITDTHLNEVQAAIVGHESCDLLAVLDELHPDTLPDGRIGLFGFNPSETHDSLGMGGTSKRIGLQGCAQVGFLVLLIMPLLVPPVAAELPGKICALNTHCAGVPGNPRGHRAGRC
uniref:Uncharacterized protein n=1 Tax=Peromyscus maniculatus bairdii TaxID=230844 RepID=A0A8C8UN14_PERMB